MWSLVSREIRPVGRPIGRKVSRPGVISGRTPYFMTDETFVVSDVFGALGRRQVDPVHVHSHGVFGVFWGSGVSGGVSLSAS